MQKLSDNITLTILGGGKEIGANSYLLQWGQKSILLDCGMNPRRGGYRALPELDILKEEQLDAIAISHAHLDHIGSLPFVTSHYLKPGGKIYLTGATADLIHPMLLESVKAVSRRIPPDEQYYYHRYADHKTLRMVKRNLVPCAIACSFDLEGLRCTFYHSGHILGAAGMVISDGDYTLLYTGDICIEDQVLLKGCNFPKTQQLYISKDSILIAGIPTRNH